jgi:hypothetical protein
LREYKSFGKRCEETEVKDRRGEIRGDEEDEEGEGKFEGEGEGEGESGEGEQT